MYAEAAATGGRIENYCKVVGEIKERAEVTTKMLIPNLEAVISDLLKANHIVTSEVNVNQVGLQQHQQSLKQALLQQQQQQRLSSSVYSVNDHQHPPYNLQSQSQPQPQPQPPAPQQQYPDTIIPDDSFAFGFIPEIPPE